MSTSFFQWLTETARARDSLLCIGLDPRVRDVQSLRTECFRLMDATAEFAAAFKVNSAFFEIFGAEGLAALRDVIAHVPRGIPVILDAKRGDIADTSEAYARAAFDALGAHAITVNPYLGHDALVPFFARPERGVFVLCKTSNPDADEFQRLRTPGGALFEAVAERAHTWNAHGNVGLVVGATDPAALARVRAIAPDLWFLVPGVGAQGGDLGAALRAALRPDGLGVLINVSRALADSADPRAAARRLRDEMNHYRASHLSRAAGEGSPIVTDESSRTSDLQFKRGDDWQRGMRGLASDLIDSGCVRFGEFVLKSGMPSPIYMDLRRLVSHPTILQRVARAYAQTLRAHALHFDRLAGIPYAALPIGTALALEMNQPLIYPRREVKDYGTRAVIEGDYAPGETAVVIDDLATTGGTKIETIRKLEGVGLIVRDVVVLIDREQGARESLAAAGYTLYAVTTLRELLEDWRRAGAIAPEQLDRVAAYLKSN